MGKKSPGIVLPRNGRRAERRQNSVFKNTEEAKDLRARLKKKPRLHLLLDKTRRKGGQGTNGRNQNSSRESENETFNPLRLKTERMGLK